MNIGRIILTCFMLVCSSAEVPPFLVKRHYKGDLFEHKQGRDCNLNVCSSSERHAVPVTWRQCLCQCLPLTPTFRQDTGQCVDDVDECQLVPFQSPVASENIPLVSMPDTGKSVHPSAEIVLGRAANHFNDVVCHVLGERFLSPGGWLPLANLSLPGPTFQLVHNSKKIFLQFAGVEHERPMLDGQLILVEFSCKTKTNANIVPHPCAAFRVAGKLAIANTKEGLIAVVPPAGRWRDWIIIGFGAGLLGVTYILAILVYLVVRKRHEKKMSNTNSQLRSISSDDRSRGNRKAVKASSACSEGTSLECANVDNKFHSRIIFPEVTQNPSSEDLQSGPSRLISQLRDAWNAATMKLRGRRLTFSPSPLDPPEESASFCRRSKSPQSVSEVASRSLSPQSVGSTNSSCNSSSSGTWHVPHPRAVRVKPRTPDPVPLLSNLHQSSNRSMRKLPETKKKKSRHSLGQQQRETSETGSTSVDRCKGHCCSFTDSVRRKAASCDNITVLTISGSGNVAHTQSRKGWSDDCQHSRWEKPAVVKGKGYHSLRRGTSSGGGFGVGRSESTCSIDCKRKSVSFDLRDTVILGDEPAAATVKGPFPQDQQQILDDEEPAKMRGSELPVRKMTNFATLRQQSRSSEFLHLNDHGPRRSIVRIGRSESDAGDYGSRLVEDATETQKLASILKRGSEQSQAHPGNPLIDVQKPHPATVSRSQSVAHPGQRQKDLLERRIPVKSLVDSFYQKTSGAMPAPPVGEGKGPENKRIWQVVNEDSGYNSSDSDKSLMHCGQGRRTPMGSKCLAASPEEQR